MTAKCEVCNAAVQPPRADAPSIDPAWEMCCGAAYCQGRVNGRLHREAGVQGMAERDATERRAYLDAALDAVNERYDRVKAGRSGWTTAEAALAGLAKRVADTDRWDDSRLALGLAHDELAAATAAADARWPAVVAS